MLNRQEIKDYRERRGVTQRAVAAHCNISQTLVAQIENGKERLTENAYREIIKGINDAYTAKLAKAKEVKEVKEDTAEAEKQEVAEDAAEAPAEKKKGKKKNA